MWCNIKWFILCWWPLVSKSHEETQQVHLPSTQHFPGGWQKQNNNSESTWGEAGGEFSDHLFPFSHFPLVRMPDPIPYSFFQNGRAETLGIWLVSLATWRHPKKGGWDSQGKWLVSPAVGFERFFFFSVLRTRQKMFVPRRKEEIT